MDSSSSENRWATLLNSGSRTRRELKYSLESVQQEAMENTNYLGLELDGLLSVNINRFGSGSMDGSTRTLTITQIKDLRGAVIYKQ